MGNLPEYPTNPYPKEIGPFRKKMKKGVVIYLLIGLLVIIAVYVVRNIALASNQPPVDPITQYNNQINEIDKKLMENSQFWNGFDQENKAMQKNIEENNKLMQYHEGENQKLRDQKAKLIAEKEAKLLGK